MLLRRLLKQEEARLRPDLFQITDDRPVEILLLDSLFDAPGDPLRRAFNLSALDRFCLGDTVGQAPGDGRLAQSERSLCIDRRKGWCRSVERRARRQGAAPDDGFTSYEALVGDPPRTRWGDYGAAAVDGNSIWIASEYIAQACDYIAWGGPFFVGGTGDNLLGTCGGAGHGPGARTALANWSTRISQFKP